MNEEKQIVAVADESSPKFVVLNGGTIVNGTNLVSDKLIGIVNEIMKLDVCADKSGGEMGGDNFGVRNITFKNDGNPAGKVGMAYVDAGAIAINLEEIWSSCLTALEEGQVKLSMTGIVWHELIKTVLHEVHHIDSCRDPEMRKIMEEDVEGAELEAEELANGTIADLVKTLDIEPSYLSEMPFFSVKLMELMTTMGDEEWIVRAKLMLEEEVMYYDEDNDITLTSFREYIRGIADPDSKDDSFEQGVSVIDLIFKMDDGSVIKTAEVLPEPEKVVETTTEEQIKEVFTAPGAIGDDKTATPGAEQTVGMNETAQALFAPAPTEETVAANLAEEAPASEQIIETVQLPDHIVAEQQQVAAAAVAAPVVAPPATSYEPNGLSDATIIAFAKDVYMRLYTNIFSKCGWQLNSDQGFTNPAAVLEPITIADLIQLHNAPNLIMEYDTLNAAGNRQPEKCEGYIRGTVFTKSNNHGIPAYCIYLNINGMRVKRSLIAQNPAKITNGQYSPKALEARAGHAIAWLFSEDENKKFVAVIKDNVYEAL